MRSSTRIKRAIGILTVIVGCILVETTTVQASNVKYEVVIEAQYDETLGFNEGLAPVRKGDKWGYINEQGEVVFDFIYDKASIFKDGLAIVGKQHEEYEYEYYCGFINKQGEYTPFMWDGGSQVTVEGFGSNLFQEGYTLFQSGGSYDMFDTNGKYVEMPKTSEFSEACPVYNYTEGLMAVGLDSNFYTPPFAYMDQQQNIVLRLSDEIIGVRPFNQGVAPVKVEQNNKGLIGFINTKGEWVIEPEYINYRVMNSSREYKVFAEGIAIVQNDNEEWGGINFKNQVIIPFVYEDLKNFNGGLAPASKNNKWGYIDKEGNVEIDFIYDEANPFNEEYAIVKKDGECYLIDKQGVMIEDSKIIDGEAYFLEEGKYIAPFAEGLSQFELNGQYGFATLVQNEIDVEQEKLIKAFVERFYEVCMGRPGDEGGITYWTNLLITKKVTAANMAEFFVKSEEFMAKDLSNRAYVETMYEVFFDRTADQGGIDYWCDKLEKGLTMDFVLAGFINSNEFDTLCTSFKIKTGFMELTHAVDRYPEITQFVHRFYSKCLGREPELEGLNYWVQLLAQGDQTGSFCARFFVFSEEFISNQYSDEEFINIMYEVFFDRTADQGGKEFWLQELHEGQDKEFVANNFIGSNEFMNICERYGIAH